MKRLLRDLLSFLIWGSQASDWIFAIALGIMLAAFAAQGI